MRPHPHFPFLRRRGTVAGPSAEDRLPGPAGRRPDPRPSPERQLADETEAFLQGTLAGMVAAQVHFLPPWLVVNRVAHADIDELHRLARGEAAPVIAPDAAPAYGHAWAMAELSLVLHLLGSESDPAAIRRVQREELVPLELALITFTAVEPLTLGAVVAEVVEVIDERS